MSEMIERVAKAIDPTAWAIPEEDYPAERIGREAKQFAAMSAAMRVLESMSEPTAKMISAVSDPYDGPSKTACRYVWIGMVEEAIK